jgi:hypothetical protein
MWQIRAIHLMAYRRKREGERERERKSDLLPPVKSCFLKFLEYPKIAPQTRDHTFKMACGRHVTFKPQQYYLSFSSKDNVKQLLCNYLG